MRNVQDGETIYENSPSYEKGYNLGSRLGTISGFIEGRNLGFSTGFVLGVTLSSIVFLGTSLYFRNVVNSNTEIDNKVEYKPNSPQPQSIDSAIDSR